MFLEGFLSDTWGGVAETWDLCCVRRDGEAHLAKLRASLVFVWRRGRWEKLGAQRTARSLRPGGVGVGGGERVTQLYHCQMFWSAAITGLTDESDELFP